MSRLAYLSTVPRTDDRAIDDVAPPVGKAPKYSRRMHSDMSVFSSQFPRQHTSASRAAFWDTVLGTNSSSSSSSRAHALPHASHSRLRSHAPPPEPRVPSHDYRLPPLYQQQQYTQLQYQPPPPPAPPVEVLMYRCSECSAAYRSSNELVAHKQTRHMRTTLRPHKCDRCSLCFSQRSHLNQHVRTVHDKHKPFQCPKCNKSFGKRFDLTSHCDAVHDNERPHACAYCPKAFAKRSNLTRHMEKLHPTAPPLPTASQRRRLPL